jgi:hypothetical protein
MLTESLDVKSKYDVGITLELGRTIRAKTCMRRQIIRG